MKDKLFTYLIKNKIPVFLVILILSFVGYILAGSIPQGVFPNVFFPRVQVSIENGYTPIKQMLFQVTKPAEESLKTVQGVEKIISSTSIGLTDISLNFDWKMDSYFAYQLVQARIAEIKNEIPPEARTTVIQATPSRFPIAMYSIGSNKVLRDKLTNELIYTLRPILLSVNGIQDVDIKAPEREEYKILLNLEKLQTYKMDIDTLIKILQEQDTIQFLGLIKDYQKQYVLSLNQKPDGTVNISDIKIPLSSGQYIGLSDIATIIKDREPLSQISGSNSFKYGVVFEILRQPNANSVEVMKEVDDKIAEFNKTLNPDGIYIRKSYDETSFIKDAVRSVIEAIILGTIIASFIVFLFLRKVKLSLFLAFIVPIIFLITIIGIDIGKFDFNIFTLGGMAAAVGGLIDHLIIVIENIERHYRQTNDKLKAVIEGSKEILPIMTAATLISILIFIPLLLVSGVVGVFFKQLAFVLISTYIISQLLAVFFTPIIAYISLPANPEVQKEDKFDRFVDKYTLFLRKTFNKSWIAVPIIIIGFLSSFLFFKNLPSTFLPKWDEGNFVVDITLPFGTSVDETYREFQEVGKIISQVPEVQSWTLRIGTALGQVATQPNTGDILVVLKKNRHRSVFEIQDELRQKISSKFPDFQEFDLPQVLEDRLADILGEEAPISVILYGTDPDKLITWGEKVRDALRKVDGLEEVNLKTNYTSPSIDVRLKPDAETLYGIDTGVLSSQINSLYFGQVVGNVIKGERIIGLRLLLESPDTDPINYLKDNLMIFSPKSQVYVPLRYVADLKFNNYVPEINHYNLSPVAITTVRFKGNNMSQAVSKVKSELSKLNIPKDITPEISGFYKEQQKSFNEMSLVIALSIFIIFTALLFQFGSLSIAISILIGLVLTLTGVFIGLLLTFKPLDITAFMGMLIVLSIVINNNILIFDYYKMHLAKNENTEEAILNAIKARFRPIFMTMLSNVSALLPVALAFGTGTQIIQDMAIAIMGGLTFAIFVNLFLIPLIIVKYSKR